MSILFCSVFKTTTHSLTHSIAKYHIVPRVFWLYIIPPDSYQCNWCIYGTGIMKVASFDGFNNNSDPGKICQFQSMADRCNSSAMNLKSKYFHTGNRWILFIVLGIVINELLAKDLWIIFLLMDQIKQDRNTLFVIARQDNGTTCPQTAPTRGSP